MKPLFITIKGFCSNYLFCLKILAKSNLSATITITVLNIITSITPFVNIYLMGKMLNDLVDIIQKHDQLSNIIPQLLVLLSVIFVLKIITDIIKISVNRLNEIEIQNLLTYINIEIMKQSTEIDIDYFDSTSKFDDMTQTRQNAHAIHEIVFSLNGCLISISTLFVNLAISVRYSPLVCLFTLFLSVPKMLYKFKSERQKYKFEKDQHRDGRRLMYISELLFDKTAAKEMRLFGISDLFMGWHKELQKRIMKQLNSIYNNIDRKNVGWGIIDILISLAIKGFYVSKTLANLITIGEFTIVTSIFDKLIGSIQTAVDDMSNFTGYYDRIVDFRRYFSMQNRGVVDGVRILTSIERIEFQNVSFNYQNTPEILKNLNFTLLRGEKIMLTGSNGSGKTSIIKLLLRFYEPTAGNIYINDVKIQEYNIKSLRKMMAVTFQDFFIYSISIRENVEIGNAEEKLDDDKILRSLSFSDFNNEIFMQSRNLNLMIGRDFDDNGIELSGGHRQKLAISRVPTRDADMVILDEPAASLDAVSEKNVLEACRNMCGNEKILLIISHRFVLAQTFDKIIFINNNGDSSVGTHEELHSHNLEYKAMCDIWKVTQTRE